MAEGVRPKVWSDAQVEELVAEMGKLRIALRALLQMVRPTDENEQRLVEEAREVLGETDS